MEGLAPPPPIVYRKVDNALLYHHDSIVAYVQTYLVAIISFLSFLLHLLFFLTYRYGRVQHYDSSLYLITMTHHYDSSL